MTACFIFIISNLSFSMQWSLLPDWKKLSISSNFCTPTVRREPPSVNVLADPGTPQICAPFQQIPSLHNSWRTVTQDEGPRASSKRRCPTKRRSHHLREIEWLDPSRQRVPGKSPELVHIFPELILHAGSGRKFWLCGFFTFCMPQLKISSIWRRALVVSIFKPNKILGDQRSYRLIYLLCVPFKMLERLIYAFAEPILLIQCSPRNRWVLDIWGRP